jgi:hypothetical protein
MPRGGRRPGAGSKPKWLHGKTKTIRVPEVLADRVLQIARKLDERKFIDDVTQSKYINLSGIPIRTVRGRPAVFVEDLIKAGFTVRPASLSSNVRKLIDRGF